MFRGLRIHQGINKCTRDDEMQLCTVLPGADKTRRIQSQVEHHSATEPTVADSHIPPEVPDINSLVKSQVEERTSERRRTILAGKITSCCPKANNSEIWRKLNDLALTLKNSQWQSGKQSEHLQLDDLR